MAKEPKVFLKDPNEAYKVPLIGKENISWNTRRFRFGLPSDDYILGHRAGQHIKIIATIKGESVGRPYSPITLYSTRGYFDCVIKIYFANQSSKFPNGGKLTPYLDKLKLGDTISIQGPEGKMIYFSKGDLALCRASTSSPEKYHFDKIGFIAGGTGIAPPFRIMKEINADPEDKTQAWLLFANDSVDDILLRKEIDELVASNPKKFKAWYTVLKSSPDWNYSVGLVSQEMIKNHIPPPSDDTIILMCGPPMMIESVCLPGLSGLGHKPNNWFVM